MSHRSVIFISGRNSDPKKGLFAHLRDQFDLLDEVAINTSFLNHDFDYQVTVVHQLLTKFASVSSPPTVIAHSYGAYLTLHSVINQQPLPIKLLLISPITGFGSATGMRFMAPGRKRMKTAIEDRLFPKLNGLILVGNNDQQTSLESLNSIAQQSSLELIIAEDQSHAIEPAIVQAFIAINVA